MATITLRPSADVTIGHTKYENNETSKASAYTLIDDTTSDEAATTIGQAHHSTNLTTKTSTFKLGGATYNHKIFVNSITVYYDYYCNNPAKNGKMTSVAASVAISINGNKSNAIKNSISDVGTESDSGSWKVLNSVFTPSNYSELNNPFDSISAMNLQFDISTEWKCGAGSVTNDQHMYISMVYAVVDYTDAYDFIAVGDESVTVVSPGTVKDGTTVYFEATPLLNHKFIGWYSDSGRTSQVSTSQSYAVKVNGANKTFYASGKKIEAINVYYKKNGAWAKVQSLWIKENGSYKEITAQEFGNALYFSDKTYLNL